jgi:uncharacterized protein
MKIIENNIDFIRKQCKLHNVKHLFLFGSALRDDFNEKSDIDFIVDFDGVSIENYADNYFDLKFLLEDRINRPIDLIEEKAIKNPFFKQNIDKSKVLIYGH